MQLLHIAGSALIENKKGEWLVVLDISKGDPSEAELKRVEVSQGHLILDFDVFGTPWQADIDVNSPEGKKLEQALYNGGGLLVYAANGANTVLFGPHRLMDNLDKAA